MSERQAKYAVAAPPSQPSGGGKAWTWEDLGDVTAAIREEMWRAGDVPPFASAHEAIAKVREEYLELEAEIFEHKREQTNWPKRRTEALHLAAVCVKLILEFRDHGEEGFGE